MINEQIKTLIPVILTLSLSNRKESPFRQHLANLNGPRPPSLRSGVAGRDPSSSEFLRMTKKGSHSDLPSGEKNPLIPRRLLSTWGSFVIGIPQDDDQLQCLMFNDK